MRLSAEHGPDTEEAVERLRIACQELINEVNSKSEEVNRFAANLVIAGTSVLEVFDPKLQGISGIRYWSQLPEEDRVVRIDGAKSCIEDTTASLRFVRSPT